MWLAAAAALFLWPRGDEASPADAVVVLAGERSLRLPRGLELFRRGVAPVLVVSDGRRLAPELCRSERVVCFVPDPFSTTGEAEGVARLARERGWDRVLVVTSSYHVLRTRLLFERCLGDALRVVAAGQALSKLDEALLFEPLKLVWALTIDRGCQ